LAASAFRRASEGWREGLDSCWIEVRLDRRDDEGIIMADDVIQSSPIYSSIASFIRSSGVGLAAIQLAREVDAIPYVTASAEKHQYAIAAGAEAAIDYKKGKPSTCRHLLPAIPSS